MTLHWILSSMSSESPGLDTALQLWPHQWWIKGKDHLLQLGDNALVNAAQEDVGLFCHKGILLAQMFKWCPLWTPRPFLSSYFPAGWPLACTDVWGCSSKGAVLCTSPCWTLMFLSANFSSLSGSICIAAKLPTTNPQNHCGTNVKFLILQYKTTICQKMLVKAVYQNFYPMNRTKR